MPTDAIHTEGHGEATFVYRFSGLSFTERGRMPDQPQRRQSMRMQGGSGASRSIVRLQRGGAQATLKGPLTL